MKGHSLSYISKRRQECIRQILKLERLDVLTKAQVYMLEDAKKTLENINHKYVEKAQVVIGILQDQFPEVYEELTSALELEDMIN